MACRCAPTEGKRFMLDKIIATTSDVLYSYILIILLVLCGLYFTIRTRFAQFRLLGQQIKCVTDKPKDGKGVSSFQALMVSTASRVGTGNSQRSRQEPDQ